MRNCFVFVLFTLYMLPSLHAQEYWWKLGFDYFFDNQEYAKSSFTDPQTMNGIWLNSLAGISWDSTHTIYGGVNLLKIPGMKEAVDKVDVTLYYQYETPKVLLRAGAFPRKEVLPNYSDFFFKDSVNHFMPLMQGIFWQTGGKRNFFNACMDGLDRICHSRSPGEFFRGVFGKSLQGYILWRFSIVYVSLCRYPTCQLPLWGERAVAGYGIGGDRI